MKQDSTPRIRIWKTEEKGSDIADEQARSWERVREIEAESTNRCAKSGEATKSIIVSSLGYVRCRRAPLITPTSDPSKAGAIGNVLGLPGSSRQRVAERE